MSKSQLGQFYTTNYDYILQNMIIPESIDTIIEPFVGNGDLLNFIQDKDKYRIEMYDIDPKIDNIVQGWARDLDTTRAIDLGFKAENNFEEIIKVYIEDDLNK